MDSIYLDAQPSKNALLGDLASSFDNPDTFPDLVVTSACGASFRVHKLVVCKQSAWFARTCAGGFKESQSSQIKVQDEEREVRVMLKYCYAFDYESTEASPCSDAMPTHQFHVKMFAMAEFYQVRGLANLASKKFESSAEEALKTGKVVEVAEAIEYAYENTTDQAKLLRNVIKILVLNNKSTLFGEEDMTFQNLLEKVHSFAVDMTLAMARDNPPPTKKPPPEGTCRLCCPKCCSEFDILETARSKGISCASCRHILTALQWKRYYRA